jgi:hypothetical protein
MQKITTVEDLNFAIRQLESKQAQEWPLLKEQFLLTYESFKPMNVLKNTFKELTSSPEIKDNLLGTAVGLTAGFISNTLLGGVSKNPIKSILGSLVQFGISTLVAKNPETIKSVAGTIIKFFGKEKVTNNENSNGEHV